MGDMGARGAASVEGKIVKRKAERNEQNDRDKAPEAQPAAQQPTVCDDRAVHSNLQKRSPAAVFRRRLTAGSARSMPTEIKVPEAGESVTRVLIGRWLKREQDFF